jgi:predicted dehydrogenase
MIKIAVVGCGHWGPNLLRNFISLSDCKVRKICDVDSERLSHLKSLYPSVETTQDFNKVTKDPEVDAVVIATPVRFHFEMAKASLKAGKHTFVEKPMASSAAECEELIEIAENKNLTLMIGHTFVYSASVQRIKEIIDSGDLGQVQYICSQRLNLGLFQKDINVAWDLATHDISIILYIMKERPVSVNCQGKAHVNDNIEDVTNMTLNFADGGLAIILSSWLDPNKVRKITVVGNKKMLVYDDLETIEKIKIYDKRVEIPPHYDTFAEFQYAYHYGDIHSPYIKMVEPLKVESQHFLDCIKNGTKPLSSGNDGLQVVQVLEASSKSLKQGGAEVRISY